MACVWSSWEGVVALLPSAAAAVCLSASLAVPGMGPHHLTLAWARLCKGGSLRACGHFVAAGASTCEGCWSEAPGRRPSTTR